MKKSLSLIVIIFAITLISCGGANTGTEIKTDSTSVTVDTLEKDTTACREKEVEKKCNEE